MSRICDRLNDEEYAEAFEIFKNNMSRGIYELAKPVIKQYNKPINFLSVGAGTGIDENHFITVFGLKVLTFHAFEPNKHHHRALENTVKSWSVKNYICVDRCFTAESTPLADNIKYDLILMSHIFYHIKDKIGVIKNAMSMLAPDGNILIFHQLNSPSCNKVLREHMVYSKDPLADDDISSEFIHNLLKKENISCSITHKYDAVGGLRNFIKSNGESCNFMDCAAISLLMNTNYIKLPEDIKRKIYESVKNCVVVDGEDISYPRHNSMVVVTTSAKSDLQL